MFNPDQNGRSQPREFNGNYRGRVISDNDPYGAGRVKVRVQGVYDGLPDGVIPWATFADPLMGGQAGLGGFIVPDVGSDVWVFFEGGNHMLPVYFAGAPARPHGPSERQEGARNKVFRTKAGHLIEIDDSEGNSRIHIRHNSGTDFEIDDVGNITERCVGNIVRIVEGNYEETIEGDVIIRVTGDVTETFSSNFRTNVSGDRQEMTNGNTDHVAGGNLSVSGARIDINEGQAS